jgi:hypothetical protein
MNLIFKIIYFKLYKKKKKIFIFYKETLLLFGINLKKKNKLRFNKLFIFL